MQQVQQTLTGVMSPLILFLYLEQAYNMLTSIIARFGDMIFPRILICCNNGNSVANKFVEYLEKNKCYYILTLLDRDYDARVPKLSPRGHVIAQLHGIWYFIYIDEKLSDDSSSRAAIILRHINPFRRDFADVLHHVSVDMANQSDDFRPCVNTFRGRHGMRTIKRIDKIRNEQYINHELVKRLCDIVNSDLAQHDNCGFLLHGKPGTGKSTAIKELAIKMRRDITFFPVDNNCNSNLYNIDNKAIIVFEDCVKELAVAAANYAKKMTTEVNDRRRDAEEESGLYMPLLLNRISGSVSTQDVIYIFTSNMEYDAIRQDLKILDSLFRHGRIGHIFEVRRDMTFSHIKL